MTMVLDRISPEDVERQTIGEMVAVLDMFHDLTYSRGVSEAQVQKMAGGFDQNAVGVLYVSLRPDGRYAVLDGCHRHAAACAAGITHLPARVYLDLTIEEEAALFAHFNRDRRAMKPGEIFRARLAAHDPRAIEILRIVHGAGMELAYHGGSDPGRIQAIASLEKVYGTHGAIGLREVLAIAVESWGTKETRGFTSTALTGIAAFWVRYREQMDRKRLIDRLRLAGPTQLMAKSNTFRTVMIGMSADQAFGRTMLNTYNTGLRETSKLPEWAERSLSDTAKAGLPARHRKMAATRRARKSGNTAA